MKPYFHELSEEEYNTLVSSNITTDEIMEKYSQPAWCEYDDALEGPMGCWGLVGGYVNKQGVSYCLKCDCYKKVKNNGRV